MTVYLNNLNENWVVDRLKDEWQVNNKDLTVLDPNAADVIWLIAPWTWNNVRKKFLKKKKVICSIYHIEEFKLSKQYVNDFYKRDKYVNEYHVISKKTESQLKKMTDKKITHIPFWVNQNIFFEIEQKEKLRHKYGLESNDYLIGSFQRDSEGSDPKKPKYIKGPDQFLQIIKHLKASNKNLKIVLTGKRRDYIKNELTKIGVDYQEFAMVDFNSLNELYNCLDLYIVASRIEGGPQAILECAITKTPIISTDVGVASEILHTESIFNMNNFEKAKPNTEVAFQNSQKHIIPDAFVPYRKLLST